MGIDAGSNRERMIPYVSVIMSGYYSYDTLPRTLESLKRQTHQDFETILVNSSPEFKTTLLIREHYSWVRFYQHPHRLLMHAARNKGVSIARGKLLLFTDPDIELSKDWVNSMRLAHQQGHHFLIAEMDCRQRGLLPMGIHLTKFHFLLPGVRRKYFAIAPTASAGYDHQLFRELGGFQGDKICSDALLSWEAARHGYKLYRVPNVAAVHQHDHTLCQFIRERRHRGEEFMRIRIRFEEWSRRKIYYHIALFPFLIFFILVVAGQDSWTSGWFRRYLRTLPVQFLGQLSWCWGETVAQLNTLSDRL